MNKKITLSFLLFMCLITIFQLTSLANEATKTLISTGNLTAPRTINGIPSELKDDKTRGYFKYYTESGGYENEEVWSYNTKASLMMFGVDIGVGPGQLSAGYSYLERLSETKTVSDYWEARGYHEKLENKVGTIDIGYTYTDSKNFTAGILASRVTYQGTYSQSLSGYVWTSNNSSTKQGTATVEYWSYLMKGTYQFGSGFSTGFGYSPGVSEKKDLDGDYTGLEMEVGNGNRMALSAGYQQETFSAELVYYTEAEQKESRDGKSTILDVMGEYLVNKDFSLFGEYWTANYSKIDDGDIYVQGFDQQGMCFGARGNLSEGEQSYEIQYLTISDTYNTYKDDDSYYRRKSGESSRITLTFATLF